MTDAGTPWGEPRRDALADNPMSVEEIRDWTENATMTPNLRAGMRALLAQAAALGEESTRLKEFIFKAGQAYGDLAKMHAEQEALVARAEQKYKQYADIWLERGFPVKEGEPDLHGTLVYLNTQNLLLEEKARAQAAAQGAIIEDARVVCDKLEYQLAAKDALVARLVEAATRVTKSYPWHPGNSDARRENFYAIEELQALLAELPPSRTP